MATSSFVWSWSQVPWLLLICGTLWTCPIVVKAQVTDSARNGCGHEMTAPSGQMELPSDMENGSPITCEWAITVASGYLVQFIIDDFYYPSYEDCKTNANVSRLELLQPTGQGGALESLAVFCWHDSFLPVRSVNNSLVVRLSLKRGASFSSFSAHYTSIREQDVTSCGGPLRAKKGEIRSPNYPERYLAFADCRWNIIADPQSTLHLSIHEIDLPCYYGSSDTSFGSVWIHDGDSTLSPVLAGPWCGRHGGYVDPGRNISRPWRDVKSSSNNVLVRFVSGNNTAHGRGFRINWIVLEWCFPKNMSTLEDQFGLPNDTKKWLSGSCEWNITVPSNYVVQLSIDSLSAAYNSEANYLLVLNVQSGQENTLARLQFNDQPWLIRSNSSSVVVRLVLGDGGSSTDLVFKAHYKAILASEVCRECGGDVSGPGGEIVSPNYPEHYDNFLDCQWLITVNSSSQILLDFNYFVVEDNCQKDSLQVRDGSDITAPQLLSPFCGNYTDTVRVLKSSTNVMLVKFVTDEQVTASGFNATWTAVNRYCGGNQTGSGGVLQSPLYPGNYPHNASCSWVLTARRGYSVRLTFRHFDLEDSTDCRADFVEVANSWGSHRLCGDGTSVPVMSKENVLHVQFVSNAAVSDTGFTAEWFSVCEELLWEHSGKLIYSSSTFELAVGEETECIYLIKPERKGYMVHLIISDFEVGDMPSASSCPGIYIEIRDGVSESAGLLGTVSCDSMFPSVFTSSGNTMWVRYISDGSSNNVQFKASYSAKRFRCETVELKEAEGTLTSPRFPDVYPSSMDCVWHILAKQDHVIHLTFRFFTLENSNRCRSDWLEVYDGLNKLGKYCALSIPETFTSTTNNLTVVFKSDSQQNYGGFSASYKSYDPSSDERKQYDLYPYGTDKGDNVSEAKEIPIRPGFPVRDTLQEYVFISNKGVLSFQKGYNTRRIIMKQEKMAIYAYFSEIEKYENDGGVFYQLYTKNGRVLKKASREIQQFTDFTDYLAKLVFVVTWVKMIQVDMENRATVQLVLISDGYRSFGLVFYKQNAMNWEEKGEQRIIMGFSNGVPGENISLPYSLKSEAFGKMDALIGNTGHKGMWLYRIGDSYTAEQQCLHWYWRNIPLDIQRKEAFQRLPECPCNMWLLQMMRGIWRVSHYRSGSKVNCYRLHAVISRQVAPHGKECCYSIDRGQFVANEPHAGSATAFNPVFSFDVYLQEDRRAHDVCCYKTETNRDYYCKIYYFLRPVGQCSPRFPSYIRWTWGDPHIITLDGEQYTFNGWGEYTMIRVHNFTLQYRTERAINESGHVRNATVFTAVGAKENGADVFVGLQPVTRDFMIILSGGNDYTTLFKNASNGEVLRDADILIQKSNESCVIGFQSEIQLAISMGFKSLDISVTMPTKLQNQTTGLLGNFNGVKDDDFVLPDGTVLSPNITERQIFEDFAPKWAVNAENTVLHYRDREGPANFSHPDFVPIFLDEMPESSLQAAKEFCGAGSKACIYDYFATGSAAIASDSKAIEVIAEETERLINNTAPVITLNTTITGVSGETVNFTIDGYDPDEGDVLTYHAVGDDGDVVQVDSDTGDVTVTLDITRPVSVSVFAEDSQQVRSPRYELVMKMCSGCNNHGECDYARTIPSDKSGFHFAACVCRPAWTGSDCEEDYDACEEGPCDAHQICTDLTPEQQGDSDVGFLCSECLDGFQQDSDDSTRCVDIDECAGTTRCSSVCKNIPGTYTCDCHDGYRLNSDGISCDDINECAEKTDGCQQECVNTEGSFQCQCFSGYSQSEKGSCEADAVTAELCNSAGCQHGCTNFTDDQGVASVLCFCDQGYILDPSDNRLCIDRDECQERVCSQVCQNSQGSFMCSCYPGYSMSSDQRTCIPCTGLQYGQNCRSRCDCSGRGIDCHPVKGCVCQDGWSGQHCLVDVDECAQTPDLCAQDKMCVNTRGSYRCTCAHGYVENEQGQCEDIDECSEEYTPRPCNEELKQCDNLQGSYRCTCQKGYKDVDGNCIDIDECSSSQSHSCQHLCDNVPGSYTCRCHFGFHLDADRKSCMKEEVDVCAQFEGFNCSHDCTLNLQYQAECVCRSGYILGTDLKTCLDVDECSLGTSGCSEGSVCENLPGSYRCVCPAGTVLDNDGMTCLACPEGRYGEDCSNLCNCGPGAETCEPTRGCLCKSGWTGERCEEDIDECDSVAKQQQCQAQNAQCHNFPGGYECRCAQGYRRNDSDICQDVNECADSPCDQICENNSGSYRCLCNKGFSYSLTTKACEDIDECSVAVTNQCTQTCENTIGSYRCSCHRPGYVLDNDGFSCTETAACTRTDCPSENGGCSREDCFCNSGYQLTGQNTCEWIDEDLCAGNLCQQQCAETSDGRSFVCSCNDGYALNQDFRTCRACAEGTYGKNCGKNCTCNPSNSLTCDHVHGTCSCADGWEGETCDTDINECSNPAVSCPDHSDCVNTQGSYLCQCLTGFFKNAQGQCEACASNMYGANCATQCECTAHAHSCDNVNGQCQCQTGWQGVRCETDVDECSTNQHHCSGDHVTCVNRDGGYSCGCEGGYVYNGNTCSDVDECLDPAANDCEQVCTNTVGSYVCSCAPGFTATGNACTSTTPKTSGSPRSSSLRGALLVSMSLLLWMVDN